MILRVEIYLDSGTLKFQTNKPLYAANDPLYLCKLIDVSAITKTANFGDGWKVGNFSFTLDDADSAYRGSSEIWHGKKVVAYLYEEVLDGTWSLVERDRWIGAVSGRARGQLGQLGISATENHGKLGEILPAYTIGRAEYPNASDSALGQHIQTLTGSYTLAGGAVVAWLVGDSRYVLAQNSVVSVTGIFDPNGGAAVDETQWQLLYDADGRSIVRYTPADGEPVPEYIYCNVVGTASSNPVTCLKTTLDAALGTDVFFTGASAVSTEMDTRSYSASICCGMGDTVGDVVDEFCAGFDCFSILGSDGKLTLDMISTVSIASYDDTKILGATEREEPSKMANDVIFSWNYDFAKNQYNNEDTYKHQDSITDYGRRTDEYRYFLTRDRATAIDVTRRRIRQSRQVPWAAQVTMNFADQVGISIGDVIGLTSIHLARTGENNYLVKGKSLDWQSGEVTLDCISYETGMDYIVEVSRNYDGGDIDPYGLVVVAAGDDLTITVDPHDYQSIDYFWIDYTSYVAGETEYTFSDVAADHSFMVVFKTDRFLIEASDDGNGTISPKGSVYVESGENQSFTYTPASGKVFSHWIVDGVQSTTYPYVFSAVDAEHTIVGYSTDVVNQYVAVTIARTGTGNIDPYNNAGTYNIQLNSPLLLLFSPDVSELLVNGADVTSGNEKGYWLEKCTADISFEATWA